MTTLARPIIHYVGLETYLNELHAEVGLARLVWCVLQIVAKVRLAQPNSHLYFTSPSQAGVARTYAEYLRKPLTIEG